MRLPLGKYTAIGEAAAEGSWVLLEEATALSRILQRELLAPPHGGGNRDIDRDSSIERGKQDNDEGESEHDEGIKGGRVGGNDGDSEACGLKEDSSSGSEIGDGAGADQERPGSGDVATKKGGRCKMVTAIVIGEKAAFAMVVKSRKRVKARMRFLTTLPGVMIHARGRDVIGNVRTPLPKTFPRGQSLQVKVHAKFADAERAHARPVTGVRSLTVQY